MNKLYLTVFLCCAIVAATSTGFWSFLKGRHDDSIVLEEIQATYINPDPLVYTLILKECGEPVLGTLKVFLDCKEGIELEYN